MSLDTPDDIRYLESLKKLSINWEDKSTVFTTSVSLTFSLAMYRVSQLDTFSRHLHFYLILYISIGVKAYF